MTCAKTCHCCGKEFLAKSGAEKCCSPECHRRRKNQNLRAYRARHKDRLAYKNLTPEQKEKRRLWLQNWRQNNPEKHRAQWLRALQNNREKYRVRAREQYWKNPEKRRQCSYASFVKRRQRDPEGVRKKAGEYRRKIQHILNQRQRDASAELKDSYVRALLNNSHKIPGSRWPDSVVKCYAAILKMKRLLKQNKTTNQETK